MSYSSTASIHKSYQYDVFLSFRGIDTGKTFTSHLYEALERIGIYTYMADYTIEKGKDITDELYKSIEDSKIYIIVFSKNYASSSWCLKELAKIMECQKTTEHSTFPVFYDVEPSIVRKLNGAFGEAFAIHKVQKDALKWREALQAAANLSGWDLKSTANGDEAKVISMIVERISRELHPIHLKNDEKLIGMLHRVQDVESSLQTGLNDVRMIGIKGRRGGGKTTLARCIFNKESIHFDGISFVENVGEVSRVSGLQSLQKQVISDVLKNQSITVHGVPDGISKIKVRLCGKKVLVVLDDVDHISQLEALAGETNWFKPGSRIIIITRDEKLLAAHKVKLVHEVKLLNNAEANTLIYRYTCGADLDQVLNFEKQLKKIVYYADGLPLIINVLVSYISGKDELEWEDVLEKLERIPLIKDTLEELEEVYDEIRLDLRVLKKKSVTTVLEFCEDIEDTIDEVGTEIVDLVFDQDKQSWIEDKFEYILDW